MKEHAPRLARAAPPRIVRRGLSCRNVSAPIRIASTCARSCMACRRAAGPVSQRPSLGALVRRPSRLIPHFAITNGRRVTIHLLKASFSRLHSAAKTPLVTLIPAALSSRSRVRCAAGWVDRADHDPTDPCTNNRVRAGRRTASRGAGFERDIERGRTQRSRGRRRKALNLRVWQPAGTMITARNALAQDKNCSNRRIWTGSSDALACFSQRRLHESFLVGICHCRTLSKRDLARNDRSALPRWLRIELHFGTGSTSESAKQPRHVHVAVVWQNRHQFHTRFSSIATCELRLFDRLLLACRQLNILR